MAEWAAFAGFVAIVLAALLFLARASVDVVESSRAATNDYPATLTDRVVGAPPSTPRGAAPALSAPALFLNVLLSQGLFGSLLVIGAWYTGVPAAALGLSPVAVGPPSLVSGVVLGVSLHALNEVGGRLGERFGLGDSSALREAMTPESPAGWVVLLLVVLPLVAGFEELLFRGVLIGAFAAGFGVSPWLLAVFSSVAFALGHGAQGRVGVVVTGTLGFVLAAAFVLTGSLVTVVIAHYLVNVLEFLVHSLRE